MTPPMSLSAAAPPLPATAGGARRRVVVAMSGGVDSSVAAALLARAGHDVVGITLQLYDHGVAVGRKGSCCAGQDIHDARRVASDLGIPHYVLDYEARFAGSVMDAFAASYAAGETPIPCVACNSQIKFRDLLAQAQTIGCDWLATGHYIQRRDTANGPELLRAVDPARDQSYFLFQTTRPQLETLWFPLGGMPKAHVRALAKELGIASAEKPDSQDICFVPDGRYAGVIARLRPDASRPGDIVHLDGRHLGRHEGIINFTIGQRKGLKLSSGAALFVVRLDAARNEVVVGPREALGIGGLELRDVNWLGDDALATERRLHVRLRSTHAPVAAVVTATAGRPVHVQLQAAEYGIACGQACVFYDSDAPEARLLGGGFIARTTPVPPALPPN